MTNTDTLFNWAEEHDAIEDIHDIPIHIIQLGIDRTTGPGNRTPNPYQVCSYLLNFEYIQHVMWHSAMRPIREYIAMHYNIPQGRPNYAGDPEVRTDEYVG